MCVYWLSDDWPGIFGLTLSRCAVHRSTEPPSWLDRDEIRNPNALQTRHLEPPRGTWVGGDILERERRRPEARGGQRHAYLCRLAPALLGRTRRGSIESVRAPPPSSTSHSQKQQERRAGRGAGGGLRTRGRRRTRRGDAEVGRGESGGGLWGSLSVFCGGCVSFIWESHPREEPKREGERESPVNANPHTHTHT